MTAHTINKCVGHCFSLTNIMDRNAREGKTRRALLFSNRANNYRLNSSNRGYIYTCQSRRTRKPVRKRCLFAWSFKWSLADECSAVSRVNFLKLYSHSGLELRARWQLTCHSQKSKHRRNVHLQIAIFDTN